MTTRKKTYLTFLLLIFLIPLSLFVFRQKIRLLLGNYLVIEDELYPSDVIHVIAGDDYRTNYAIQLYKQGYTKYIFFTGGWCKYHGYYHGAHAQELALSQGVPEEAVIFDDSQVTSTYDETALLKAWIAESPIPISSVIVVSDPFHMRRARWTAQHLLWDEIDVLMAPVPFEQTPYQQQWWTDSISRNYVKNEYIKSIYYFFRYQLSMDWLASLDTD
jgi:uncharacterized SAM-binding protein YcdF (DUF218 family)